MGMTLNVHVQRIASAFAIVGTLAGGAWLGIAAASADPIDTINLTDVPDIDTLPVCHVEDCSDQPGQIGVWIDRDTGNAYLQRGETCTGAIPADCTAHVWRIIDNTVSANAYDLGAYVGGYN